MNSKRITHCFKKGITINQVVMVFSMTLTLFAIAVGNSVAATYYIAPGGSDSNPGTITQPWLNPSKVNNTTFAPGDTIYFRAGTYDISAYSASFSCPAIHPNAATSGTVSQPITIAAYPGETVYLDGKNVIAGGMIGICATLSNYITFDGFNLINPKVGPGVDIFGVNANVNMPLSDRVVGTVAQNFNICCLYDPSTVSNNVNAVRLEGTTGTVIRNNIMHNIHSANGGGNATGVTLYFTDHVTIEHNEIYDAEIGIHPKSIAVSTIIRYNYLHDFTSTGYELLNVGSSQVVDGNQFYNNIIFNTGGAIYFDYTSSPITNNLVYNNTIVGYRNNAYNWGNYNGTGGLEAPGTFYNNLSYRTVAEASYGDFFDYNCLATTHNIAILDYNLYFTTFGSLLFNPGVRNCSANYTTLAAWQTASGLEAHSIQANPLFVGPLTSPTPATAFKLQTGSPAIGAGRVGGVSTGAVVDIGAYPTGTEVIGLTTSNPKAPSSPTGLTIQ